MNASDVGMPTIFPVACHTDNVGPGSTFVAIKGSKQDGVEYICQALKRGAITIVVQEGVELRADISKKIEQANARFVVVPNARCALAQLSAQANRHPALHLKFIGITGTKGKSSTAFITEHLLRVAGYKTALISTVHNKIGDTVFSASLTTEQPDYLHSFFARCVQEGVEYVVMEVAAQALSLHRVEGLLFDAVLFTNFDQEHAEFYDNLDDYFFAKAKLFEQCKPGAPMLINVDDDWGKKLLKQYPDAATFSLKDGSHTFRGHIIDVTQTVSCCVSNGDDCYIATCPSLVGAFNAYNMIGALALVSSLGVPFSQAVDALRSFSGIPGRLERCGLPNGAVCFIDKAHNPSSFHAVLSTMRAMTDDLIVVFGAGGDRDAKKRPEMGSIAAHYADCVVLTSDNPRSENVHEIIKQIHAGIKQESFGAVVTVPDRKQAIKKACEQSKKGSVIALLGKGPDEYELIGDQKIPFSERAIVRSYWEKL